MKVIAISGKACHGKDTLAGFMKTHLENKGYRVLITHYGDLLKYVCSKFFGWNGEKDETGRALLQYVGTDVVRKKQPDFWVKFIQSILGMFSDAWDFVLIPDCRFPQEVYGLSEAGFDTVHVRIVRSNFVSPLTAEQQKHPTETSLDGYEPDYLVPNDRDLAGLDTIAFALTGDLTMNWPSKVKEYASSGENAKMHIYATCPDCGGDVWMRDADGFLCAKCGAFIEPEEMSLHAGDTVSAAKL